MVSLFPCAVTRPVHLHVPRLSSASDCHWHWQPLNIFVLYGIYFLPLVNIFRWEQLCKLTITLAPRFNIFFGMFSFLQCIFLAFSIRDLRGWGLELLLVAIAIYRLRILLEGRWRVYCWEQRQAGGLMAPYPANFSIIWSNSPTNLI